MRWRRKQDSSRRSPICAPVSAVLTKMRCSRPSLPMPPISASRAWPPRAKASHAINSCGPMTPISAMTAIAALAVLINAQHRLPFSRVWGDGTTSSSDGQFFRGTKRGASGGDINARYGVDHGFSFYKNVSDQRAPYQINVISAATHEAPYVLDGLTNHATNPKPPQNYTNNRR